MTYALKQIIQLTNSLSLLPLHAANPDSRSVNGPFPPDGSAVLLQPVSDGMFEHHIQPVSLTERYRFLGLASPSRGRLAVDISIQHTVTVLYCSRVSMAN